MFSNIAATLGLVAAASAISVSITPHDKFSSSVGVLGCHIDTNRVAYFPSFPGCDTVCVEVTNPANGKKLNLLHIDQSGGAYDVSYDAWNILTSGQSAKDNPQMGGGTAVEYEIVNMNACADLIHTPDKKLPLMAANSINYYTSCPAGSFIAEYSALYNIQNSVCTLGFNEVCTLDLAVSNQPTCGHILGAQNPLSGLPVTDLVYGTGADAVALQ